MLQRIKGSESGHALVGLAIGAGLIIFLWFIFTSVLGIIGDSRSEKQAHNAAVREAQMQQHRRPVEKPVDRQVHGNVYKY